jgi:hypothetical protein
MSYLYFDESIRDNGSFIVGALVVADRDLSTEIRERWRAIGLDPDNCEYKSSDLKQGNPVGNQQRDVIRQVLHSSRVALLVCPHEDRGQLGAHCCTLTGQLLDTGFLAPGSDTLFVDQGISMPTTELQVLKSRGVETYLNQDSRAVAGLQVADHAAHALGGMLLEEMGLISKTVLAGDGSGIDPDLEIALGFELWASLRYALIGKNEEIPGLSEPGDPANPFFRVEGYGLYITPSCGKQLTSHARKRFGVNYLGCIH